MARKVFTPSEIDQYALIYHEEKDKRDIVKYSEVLSETNGEVELRNGESATILVIGEFFSVTNPS